MFLALLRVKGLSWGQHCCLWTIRRRRRGNVCGVSRLVLDFIVHVCSALQRSSIEIRRCASIGYEAGGVEGKDTFHYPFRKSRVEIL